MMLSKIYSNKHDVFEDIFFQVGLNIILGEIRNPENRNRDTHNLGKSKLCDVIDFCLLKKKNKSFFLFKNEDVFSGFVFFLEIVLNSGDFITIRRSVNTPSKISIIKHNQQYQDFSEDEVINWDYSNLAFDKAKVILDSLLDLRVLGRWDYRTALGYSLRGQNDYTDVFRLSDFLGKHVSWKPYIGHLLGFKAEYLINNYLLSDELDKCEGKLSELISKIGKYLGDEEEVLTNLLIIKRKELSLISEGIEFFDFDVVDLKVINDLVKDIEQEISELNKVRYYLKATILRLKRAKTNSEVKSNVQDMEKLYVESKIHFGDSIKKTFQELLDFHKRITEERNLLSIEQIEKNKVELESVDARLKELNLKRSESIAYFNNIDSFEKYKKSSKYLVELNVEINNIEQKLHISKEINEIKAVISKKEKEKGELISLIRENREDLFKSDDSIYSSIKNTFSVFVKNVLEKNGMLTTEQNKEGNLEYWAGIVDDHGHRTSESEGHSYQKILCMGYDISIVTSYLSESFIRFIYHDGGLETLDDRKKKNFLDYVNWNSSVLGFQYILTLIDTDLPEDYEIPPGSIIKTLHDDGDDGLLFKMKPW